MAIVREKDLGSIKIEKRPGKKLLLEITDSGLVIFSPVQELIAGVKRIEENSLSRKFKMAFVEAGASLLKHNLPESTNMPEEVSDKIDALRRATRDLLASHKKKGRLDLLIDFSEHELALLAEFDNVPTASSKQCQERLALEIEKAITEYKEGRYRKPPRA